MHVYNFFRPVAVDIAVLQPWLLMFSSSSTILLNPN
jgi:hypothetical protein